MTPLVARLRSSLSAKVVTVLAAIIMALAVLSAVGLVLLVWPTFVSIQRNDAAQDGARVQGAIIGLLDELDRTARDWAGWDDTYNFVADRNPAYAESNLGFDPTLGNELVALYGVDGSPISAIANDLETGAPLDLGALGTGLPADHPLVAHQSTDSSVRALIDTPAGLMLVASRPITHTTGEGPVRGALVMGRLFTDKQIALVQAQTRVHFEVARSNDPALAAPLRDAVAALAAGSRFHIVDTDHGVMDVYAFLPALPGAAPVVLRAEAPKDVMAAGWKTLQVTSAFLLLIGLAVSVAAWLALRGLAVAPIKSLTAHVLQLARSGDLRVRFTLPRNDEIGILAREFDNATAQLAETRARLLEQSYQSGMSEMAAGVIHNVRNALSPIAVSLWRLSEDMRKAPIANVEKALLELRAGEPSAERRDKLLQFLALATRKLAEQQQSTAEELARVAEQNRHIEQILDDHTAFSVITRVLEPVDLAELVDESVRGARLRAPSGVAIAVDAAALRALPVQAHRVVLAQILDNLLVNAIESIAVAGRADGRIEIGATPQAADGRATVHVVVRDNGAGIDPGTIAELFVRGFTTKTDKESGLGLHWCANSMTGMAGRIFAESAGRGEGAAFHLVLPAATGAATERAA